MSADIVQVDTDRVWSLALALILASNGSPQVSTLREQLGEATNLLLALGEFRIEAKVVKVDAVCPTMLGTPHFATRTTYLCGSPSGPMHVEIEHGFDCPVCP